MTLRRAPRAAASLAVLAAACAAGPPRVYAQPPASRAALSIAAVAPEPGGVVTALQREQIQGAYDAMNSAFMGGHLEQLTSVIAPEYRETDPKGHTRDRSEAIKKLQGERAQIKTMTVSYRITSATPAPGGVLVAMQMHAAGTGQKKMLFVHVNGTFTNDVVTQDYWIATPAGWELLTRKMSVDESVTRPG